MKRSQGRSLPPFDLSLFSYCAKLFTVIKEQIRLVGSCAALQFRSAVLVFSHEALVEIALINAEIDMIFDSRLWNKLLVLVKRLLKIYFLVIDVEYLEIQPK